MERSTSVPMGMGEQSLTPGEQRILALMEQGQQRLEQRLDRMEQRLDRKLVSDLEGLREEGQNQKVWLVGRIERSQKEMLEAMHLELNSLRTQLSTRLDQHDTRLGAVEHTLERHEEYMREHGQAIQGLQQEMRKLTAAVEHLALATAPSRPAQ